MNTLLKKEAMKHALSTPNIEVCGLLYHTHTAAHYFPCPNITRDEGGVTESWEINENDYIDVYNLGSILGVFHSHRKGGNPAFSEEDIISAEEICLPYYLYVIDTDKWLSYIPHTYTVDPVGKQFIWGIWDCLEVVRIHYRNKFNIHITDYDRDESFEGASDSAIVQHIADEGFYSVPKESIQIDDVLLFKTRGTAYPHHLAVYVGHNRILHHPRGSLSRVDTLNGEWLDNLAMVLRYKI